MMVNSLYSKIALGTAQFGLDYGISNNGGQTPKKEVARILQLAKQKGITVLDTAFLYGVSEEVIGAHELSGQFNIISKFPEVETTLEPSITINSSIVPVF